MHLHVVLPEAPQDPHTAAAELQRRLQIRGAVSPWDPTTIADSQAQLIASYQLESILGAHGALVGEGVA